MKSEPSHHQARGIAFLLNIPWDSLRHSRFETAVLSFPKTTEAMKRHSVSDAKQKSVLELTMSLEGEHLTLYNAQIKELQAP